MKAMGPTEMDVAESLPDYEVHSYQSTHPTGGAIMGSEPGTSVTNSYGQLWDTPNVFVTGAALFPQNPGANPTDTVGALTYRLGDALKDATSRTRTSCCDDARYAIRWIRSRAAPVPAGCCVVGAMTAMGSLAMSCDDGGRHVVEMTVDHRFERRRSRWRRARA